MTTEPPARIIFAFALEVNKSHPERKDDPAGYRKRRSVGRYRSPRLLLLSAKLMASRFSDLHWYSMISS